MLATVLYRLAGKPAVTSPNSFRDVKQGAYYEKAVAWAAENGIVSGTGNGKFSPNLSITREELATMLYRYAKLEGISTERTELSQFEDSEKVSRWAKEAMGWAVKYGIVRGKTTTTIAPEGKATRGEVAIMLKRYATSGMLRPENNIEEAGGK